MSARLAPVELCARLPSDLPERVRRGRMSRITRELIVQLRAQLTKEESGGKG